MSRDWLEGWKGQYRRMIRWQERTLESMRGNDGSETYDFIYAFFQSSYHLRDWLVSDAVVSKQEMHELFAGSTELQLCRDICNSTKHLQYDNAGLDSRPRISREWDIYDHKPSEFSLYSDKKRLISELMSSCLSEWDSFLSNKGLNVT